MQTFAPTATECTVPPRRIDETLALFGQGTPAPIVETYDGPRSQDAVMADGTPVASLGFSQPTPEPRPLPLGAETGVAATLREFVACGNAGDLRRMLALFTDDGVVRTYTRSALIDEATLPWQPWPLRLDDPPGTPNSRAFPFAPGVVSWLYPLPDGRVVVIASSERSARGLEPQWLNGHERNVYVFVQMGDRWLIDQVIRRSF